MLTIRDVAQQLNVSLNTVRRLIDRGELKCIRVSAQCLRIEDAELHRFIASRRADNALTSTAASIGAASAAYTAAATAARKARSKRTARHPSAIVVPPPPVGR